MHVFDPYGSIHEERRRSHRRRLIVFSIVWIIATSALVIGVDLALSLAHR